MKEHIGSGLLSAILILFALQSRAEETVFIPTPGMTPGQTVHFEFRPASPDVQVVGIIVVYKHVAPKKEGQAPQKDPPVIPLRRVQETAFWEKPSGKIGPFELKLGESASKGTFAGAPVLAVLSRKF
ncbi:MAG: hypothetical protein EXS51_01040 [Candidatus Taylorbacteria bacterium]|nr:hypothetical protein [Candidatus Taylorbacteria bacterium]